jgi:hypothetical protein
LRRYFASSVLTLRDVMIVQLNIIDEPFQLYVSINACFMHQATIGLGGQHIIKALIYKIDTTLRNDAYTYGKTREGRPKHIISRATMEGVWTRMLQRLANFCSDVSGFELTTKYCAHVKHVFLEGKSTFTAGRLELLFMALCFVLRDLIDPELRLIEQAIRDGKVD